MLRCAFLTLNDSTGFVIDNELAYPPLAALGWRVEAISWRAPACDWRAYDAVVIRSTWDYIADPDAFLVVLAEIESAGTPLFNALDLVRWNIRKTYLRDLAGRGGGGGVGLCGFTFLRHGRLQSRLAKGAANGMYLEAERLKI